MTRETKIGLLVGLAFIIVIGILLSDHMTSTNQPQQALLSGASANVRESVMAPAAAQTAPPPVTAVRPITPVNPVPTQAELRPPPPIIEQVHIGGPAGGTSGNAGAVSPIEIRQSAEPVVREQPQQSMTDVVPMGPITSVPPAAESDRATSDLQSWADAARPQPSQPQAQPPVVREIEPRTPAPAAQPPVAVAAGREYVAQSGDNLSRLASRMLGANTKANRDAIVKANASLQRNPDLIVEGRKYKVPGRAELPPTAPAPALTGNAAIPETVPVQRRSSAPVPVIELVDPLPPAPSTDTGEWYVVKENDNLWRIATEQLGSGYAAAQIKALNKDVLKGRDSLQPNMRLRLPAKRVASAAR